MIYRPPLDPEGPIIVIDIGNTTTSVATWHGGALKTPLTVATDDPRAFEEAYSAHAQAMSQTRSGGMNAAARGPAATVISSVAPDALERIRVYVLAQQEREALIVGETIPLPMEVGVKDKRAIGVDRVCEAAAAYEQVRAGCTVVSFGTAVTVDLVDDDGTLLGGAILPGLRMQLKALHEFTAALPEVIPGFPELPFGRNTTEAIQNGVCRGLAGAVRGLVEAYATHLNRWPQVVATGGDVAFLAPHCDFLDTIVGDLALRGVGLAYDKHLAEQGA